jgi:uncharacterized protein YukE
MKTTMKELKDKIQHAIEELNSELSEYQAGYKQCLINIQTDIDCQMLQIDMKQTAVEWLEELIECGANLEQIKKCLQKAKEMEKEQIIDARVSAPLLNTGNKDEYVIEAEQYYNETYGDE